MRLIFFLIGSAIFVVLWLIGLAWTLILVAPYYFVIGVAVYVIVRINRRRTDLAASVEIEAERQRRFNDQELNAWLSTIEERRKQLSKREKTLRRFDDRNDRLL